MNIKIGTKYPRITKKFFLKHNIDPEIVFLNGSVELAPLTGLADAIVDITETGSTIKENNLKIIETIMQINAKVIINKTSYRTLNDEIEILTSSLLKKIKI
jgi:ATP phosphoribosyltransferase